MKYLLLSICSVFIFCSAFAQTENEKAIEEILEFRRGLDKDYQDPKESPLGEKNIASFTGHRYFPIDLGLRVWARAEVLKNEKSFLMKTSGPKTPEYKKYLKLIFSIDDSTYVLYAYQNVLYSQKEEYKDHLFLPFTDKTNGFESYGGGRYIDLRIPATDSLLLDFNQCYNPYCAYTTGYNCPIPPKENALPIKIEVGILAPERH
jgi:uncharacterized protein (DUF1684 family)